MSENVCTCKEM
jgi:prefoldin subunit 5